METIHLLTCGAVGPLIGIIFGGLGILFFIISLIQAFLGLITGRISIFSFFVLGFSKWVFAALVMLICAKGIFAYRESLKQDNKCSMATQESSPLKEEAADNTTQATSVVAEEEKSTDGIQILCKGDNCSTEECPGVEAKCRSKEVQTKLKGPAAIALLIDKSRSMAEGNALGKVKEPLLEAIKLIKDDSILSITAFDDAPFLILRPVVAAVGKQKAPKRIGNVLYPAGGSNPATSLEEIAKNFATINAPRKTIILISDAIWPDKSFETSASARIDKVLKELHEAKVNTIFISVFNHQVDSVNEKSSTEAFVTSVYHATSESDLKAILQRSIRQAQ